jgi:multiple sugar transport system substrate-binding protein
MKPQPVLLGITWDHVRGYGPLEASIQPYEKATSIKVQWKKRSLKDFGDASLEDLTREYDLIIMDHPHVGTAVSKRCLLPLDELLDQNTINDWKANSVGPSFASYHCENHLWALPIDAACQVSCWRADLLNGLPVPERWHEVFTLAEVFRPKKQFIGMALCPTDCNCCFLTLCAQLGDPFEEGKLPSMTTAVEALQIIRRLLRISHPESKNWNPIRLYDYMSSNNDVVYSPLAFGYTNYSRDGYSSKKLRFGSIPGNNNALLGGAGIAISAFSKFPKEAALYASWLCDENFQATTYVQAGGQPAHKKAWTNEIANNITGQFFSQTLSTLEAAYVRPRNLMWPVFQEDLGELIHYGLTSGIPVQDISSDIVRIYRRFYPSIL